MKNIFSLYRTGNPVGCTQQVALYSIRRHAFYADPPLHCMCLVLSLNFRFNVSVSYILQVLPMSLFQLYTQHLGVVTLLSLS